MKARQISVALLLLAGFLVLCEKTIMSVSAAPPKKITVGMDWTAAEKLLRSAGAKQTKIDAAPAGTSSDQGSAIYELRNGNLLIVDYNRPSSSAAYHVSALHLCNNPDVPKASRTWQDVNEVTL